VYGSRNTVPKEKINARFDGSGSWSYGEDKFDSRILPDNTPTDIHHMFLFVGLVVVNVVKGHY
jgi:hypothetical protein